MVDWELRCLFMNHKWRAVGRLLFETMEDQRNSMLLDLFCGYIRNRTCNAFFELLAKEVSDEIIFRVVWNLEAVPFMKLGRACWVFCQLLSFIFTNEFESLSGVGMEESRVKQF